MTRRMRLKIATVFTVFGAAVLVAVGSATPASAAIASSAHSDHRINDHGRAVVSRMTSAERVGRMLSSVVHGDSAMGDLPCSRVASIDS